MDPALLITCVVLFLLLSISPPFCLSFCFFLFPSVFSPLPVHPCLIASLPPGGGPHPHNGPRHVHPAQLHDGSPDTAAQPHVPGQHRHGESLRSAQNQDQHLQLSLSLLPMSPSSFCSTCQRTQLCKGLISHNTPQCLPPASQ